jgi:zinc protease
MAGRSGSFAVFLVLGALAGCATTSPPRAAPSAAPPPQAQVDESIPIDPTVLQGALENGFRYFVRRDTPSQTGAYLALVVKAGSANETDAQRGLEHLLAHVAFKGTPRFDEQKVSGFFRGLGSPAEPDQHVAVGVDFTIYPVDLSSTSGEAVSTALDLFRAWASEISGDAAQVESARRAVLEEVRQASSAGQQLARQTLDVLLRVASPAGGPSSVEKSIEAVTPDQLMQFYRTWYRPERMALVAVGDLEPKQLETLIRDRFAGLKPVGPATAVQPLPELNRETSFAALPAPEPDDGDEEEEPEDRPPPPPTVISIGFKSTRPAIRTRANLRQSALEAVYASLVQARVGKLAREPGSPLRAAKWASVPGLPVRLSIAQGVVKPWHLQAALQALWSELGRIALSGFEPDELEAARRATTASLGAAAQPRARMDAARMMTANFLYGDALLSVDGSRALEQKLLSELRLPEVNAFARSMPTSATKVVLVSGPKEQLPPEQALRAAVARAEGGEAAPASLDAGDRSLIDSPPQPGSVVREETIDEIGVTVWSLSNGAKVVLKPSDHQRGEVSFQARAAGGTSLASDRDFWSASLAPQIISAAGLGPYEPEELQKLLAGRTVEGHPWVSETEHGIRGKAGLEDLTVMMELIYLGFTAPRADPESFDEFKDHWREQLRERDADAARAFAEIRRQQSFSNHPRRRAATLRSAGQLRLAAALDFYRQRFSHASDFTFVFVGDIDRGRLRPLVERYIASLPNKNPRNQRSQWRDVGARLATGVKHIRVQRGSGDTSTVTLTFHREAPCSPQDQIALEALRDYLEIQARRALAREPLAAGSLSVAADFQRKPIAQSTLEISFESSRALVDESERSVLQVVRQARDSAALPTDVATVRAARKQRLERDLGDNAFWAQALAEAYALGADPRELRDLRASVDRIDAAMIERAAQDDLDLHRYIEAVRSPRPNKSTKATTSGGAGL